MEQKLHIKAELATHRAELEQTIRRELELLRESITKEILNEMRSLQREKATESSGTGDWRPTSKRRSTPEKLPQTEEIMYACTAEPDRPLLDEKLARTSTTRVEPSCIEKAVMSPLFDSLASALVFLSVIVLAVQTDYMARNFSSAPPHTFRCIEISFCCIFSVEILLRLCVYRKAFFTGKNKMWNIFDFSLVSMQVTEMVVASLNNGQRLPFAPFLRCLRIARMVRVARFLRLVPELRTLIVQIFHSFLPLMWVFILVFLVTAVFAVILTQVVTDYKVQNEEEYRSNPNEHLMMFDNLPMSMLALYQTISEGKHWGELSEPLMEVNPYLALLFIGYTFFVIFAFMNVVTSHFVEEAIASAKEDERQQMLDKLEDIFGKTDNDDDNVKARELDEDEFLQVCSSSKDMKVYLKNLLQREDVSTDEVKEMQLFRILDLDGSGHISTKELVQGCERLARAPTVLDLAAFRQMCTDFFVTFENMQDKRVT